ncbi:MAG: glycoside hydrolase family 3 C-terminal domain-containing protein [Caldilineaceae bacterium]|nr:glycoside hydrolase family 3 C-terminal domain-containing protein [Caldilineaceae bacterium]
MTLEEKAALCTGAGPWATTPVAHADVPEMIVTDGPHGVRRVGNLEEMGSQSLPATCFPSAASLAATWNPGLLEEMGRALAEEAVALEVDVLLGPGVNMKRTPLCGRNFEYFSEDPYLAGKLAAALINGIQGGGVGTSLKHFAANNQEYQRFSINAEIDERTLREIYLAAFETAVKESRPWTVMCSYNKINGFYGSEQHYLLTDILKDEWGFEGLVVSDWGAVHDRVAALKAGLDLEMPGPKPSRTQAVIDAVEGGEMDEAVLDEAVRRILTIIMQAQATAKGGSFDQDAHHALARKVAAESMVLLKNEEVLPLSNPRRVAVIGRAAQHAHFQGGGSSHINPTRVDAPLDALKAVLPDSEITYSEGYAADLSQDQALIAAAADAAAAADVAVIFIALPASVESEGYDRANLLLTAQQEALIGAVTKAQSQCVVVLNTSSAVDMRAWVDDTAGIIQAGFMGQAGGSAVADVLTGAVNPSAKLAESFPLKLEDTPAYINFPGDRGTVHYGEGLYIGYRYYDAKQIPVLFPFGHGLSYTTFAYTNPAVSATEFTDADGVIVSVDVTNTGKQAGQEIVQVYVHDQKSTLHRPEKELKGFAKVALEPGETKTVEIPLDFRAFAYYHPDHQQWITEDGEFDLLIGASAADINEQLTVSLKSSLDLPSLLHEESTLQEWLDDDKGKAVIAETIVLIQDGIAGSFGISDEAEGGIGMDVMGFLMDMPLLSVLHFNDAALPQTPEEIVAGLVDLLHG